MKIIFLILIFEFQWVFHTALLNLDAQFYAGILDPYLTLRKFTVE